MHRAARHALPAVVVLAKGQGVCAIPHWKFRPSCRRRCLGYLFCVQACGVFLVLVLLSRAYASVFVVFPRAGFDCWTVLVSHACSPPLGWAGPRLRCTVPVFVGVVPVVVVHIAVPIVVVVVVVAYCCCC